MSSFISSSALQLRCRHHCFSHPTKSSRKADAVTTPTISMKAKPESTLPTTRRDFLSLLLSTFVTSGTISLTNPIGVKSAPTKRGLPVGAAEDVLRTAKFPSSWPYIDSDFVRFDQTSDENFYFIPRLVRHIDDDAVSALRSFYAREILPSAQDVCDVCSSIESYLPLTWSGRRRVAGLGMNLQELDQNKSLTERVVQDLNKNPQLPYCDAGFDTVLCALSIDYLTHPKEVCMEFGRILKDNGIVVISFSDRVFSTKAVALWMNAGDQDHIYIVASYLKYTGMFKDIKVQDISPRRLGNLTGDPLYVVTARKLPAEKNMT